MSGTRSRSYTISDQVLTAHLDGEAVVLDLETKRYYRLNASAARVWAGLERGLDGPALLADLCAFFDVEPETAAASLETLFDQLVDLGLVVPSNADSAALDGG